MPPGRSDRGSGAEDAPREAPRAPSFEEVLAGRVDRLEATVRGACLDLASDGRVAWRREDAPGAWWDGDADPSTLGAIVDALRASGFGEARVSHLLPGSPPSAAESASLRLSGDRGTSRIGFQDAVGEHACRPAFDALARLARAFRDVESPLPPPRPRGALERLFDRLTGLDGPLPPPAARNVRRRAPPGGSPGESAPLRGS
jgi:hypothetical protein